MQNILSISQGIPPLKSRNDDDSADKLNYRVTATMLIVFAVVVSTKQYAGSPIACWVPVHFKDSHEEYANNYCWIKNTYNLKLNDTIPQEHEGNKRLMLVYYQWVPLILLGQAFLFYLPCLIWRTVNSHSGLDVHEAISAAETFSDSLNMDQHDTTLRAITSQLHRFFCNQVKHSNSCTISLKHICSRTCCLCCGHQRGNFLTSLYLFVKALYVLNAIGQMFLLNAILGINFHTYAFDFIRQTIEERNFGAFPKITMCDFKVRRLGNVQRYTVQCVLPVNLFNEYIYLFLWVWFVVVAIVQIISICSWIRKLFIRTERHRYIRKNLLLDNVDLKNDDERQRTVAFIERHLRLDGVFLMRLVDANTNNISAHDVIGSLWKEYNLKNDLSKRNGVESKS